MRATKEKVQSYLMEIEKYNSKGKYKDTWESLYEYEVPEWYKDAKIGIFFHWGLYSIPMMGSEWYSRNMYMIDSDTYNYHLKHYGNPNEFGYKHFISLFNADKFNADEWVQLAECLGAKYFMPVAEHHDGFQLYLSKFSEYNSSLMGPKRDFLQELKTVIDSTQLKFAVSSHRAEHFWFMNGYSKFNSGITSPEYGDLYWPSLPETSLKNDEQSILFLEDWLARCCELVDEYCPRIMYFDWWIEMPEFKPYIRKFLAYYYNKNLEVYGDCGVVNYKHDGIPYRVAVRDVERGQFSSIQSDYWQCCTSIAKNSWSYTENNQYKSPLEIIQTFIDVISKNGNMLLNCGPLPSGAIATEEEKIFKEVGNWIYENSLAIYNTRVWKIFGEGDINTVGGNFSEDKQLMYKKYDIRFTMNKNKIYIFIMNPVNEVKFEIRSMAIKNAVLTHHAIIKSINEISRKIEIIRWERNNNCLEIEIKKHEHQLPIVFEVEVE